MTHPRDILLGAQAAANPLPVCDHYSGVEARMRKSIALQAEMIQEKVESFQDVDLAVAAIDDAGRKGLSPALPVHVLLESPAAVHRAFDIASHPRVQSVSFGLMDFVSAHGGAIPSSAMTVAGQFTHPLVVRAKLEVSASCHAHGKVPSHCVVTEFRDMAALHRSAIVAASDFGYTRMWSIHPGQIRTILTAFAPARDEIEIAAQIIGAAESAGWAPIEFGGQLHDRASYRFFWQILERAHQTGQVLPREVRRYFEIAGQ